MKRMLCVMIGLLLVIGASLTANGYTVTSLPASVGSSLTFHNRTGMYLVSYTGRDVHIERPAPDGIYADLQLSYAAAAVTVCGSTAVVLCSDYENDQLIVYTYDINYDMLDSFAILNRRVNDHVRFCCDRSGICLLDPADPSLVHRYSFSGKELDSHRFGGNAAVLIPGYTDEYYVICNRQLYRRDAEGYTPITGASLCDNAAFIGNDTVMDESGQVYRISGSSASRLISLESDILCRAAIADDGMLYYADRYTLYACDPASGEVCGYFDADSELAAVYYSDHQVFAITDAQAPETYAVSLDEFTAVITETPTEESKPIETIEPTRKPTIPPTQKPTVRPAQKPTAAVPAPTEAPVTLPTAAIPTNVSEKPNTEAPAGIISSDIYTVDAARLRITGISSPTTFAQFKSHMRFDGYQASLYRGGRMIRSGKVGTGMTVEFSGADRSIYELSVLGDLTGEGSANSRDVAILMDYLLGITELNGVFADAADVSRDAQIDALDLAILCRR